ncbi:MAG TPA: stage 0 sporulation protein [Candidatus Moranbacteria bacterium]|nr:stage 0 sporulation protein [Candidatus Moranbacteria bacterium]HAT74546.1 stage 0 sporulation protein [Candidatus Moranbacteria bacterium]
MNFLVKIYSWENPRLCASERKFKKNDKVVVSCEHFNEFGVVESDGNGNCPKEKELILRLATSRDAKIFNENEKEKEGAIDFCKTEVRKLNLAMKVVDAKISLDKRQIIFVFTSDGRIDFRELVKNLSLKFKKAIRIQQIGSRDEAKKIGGCGICGRSMCCANFKKEIPSITTDMARIQQIAHRGAERISGTCGRLMCCLAYEAQSYREMLVGMPEIYSIIDTPEGEGTVIEVNALTQEIKVKIKGGKYITLTKSQLKK